VILLQQSITLGGCEDVGNMLRRCNQRLCLSGVKVQGGYRVLHGEGELGIQEVSLRCVVTPLTPLLHRNLNKNHIASLEAGSFDGLVNLETL